MIWSRWSLIAFLVAELVLLPACRHTNATAKEDATGPYDLDEDLKGLYAQYAAAVKSAPASTAAELVKKLRAMELLAAFDALAAQIPSGSTLLIHQQQVQLTPQYLTEIRPQVQDLAKTYPTQGALWDALGVDPLKATADDFQKGRDAAVKAFTGRPASQGSAGLIDIGSTVHATVDVITKGGAVVGAALQFYNAYVAYRSINRQNQSAIADVRQQSELVEAEARLLTALCERESKLSEYQALLQAKRAADASPQSHPVDSNSDSGNTEWHTAPSDQADSADVSDTADSGSAKSPPPASAERPGTR